MESSSAPVEIRRAETLTDLAKCAATAGTTSPRPAHRPAGCRKGHRAGELLDDPPVLHDLPATPHRLQRAQIAWASRHGYRELVTATHALNVPMRAVKAKLGYVERGHTVEVRGSIR
jgi:hypothetical protein